MLQTQAGFSISEQDISTKAFAFESKLGAGDLKSFSYCFMATGISILSYQWSILPWPSWLFFSCETISSHLTDCSFPISFTGPHLCHCPLNTEEPQISILEFLSVNTNFLIISARLGALYANKSKLIIYLRPFLWIRLVHPIAYSIFPLGFLMNI